MKKRIHRQLTSAQAADVLDAPPYPVVEQFGFYSFEVNGRYPTAVTVPGIGRVYAKHFKNWAGRPLPEVADTVDFRELEPSPEMWAVLMEVEER